MFVLLLAVCKKLVLIITGHMRDFLRWWGTPYNWKAGRESWYHSRIMKEVWESHSWDLLCCSEWPLVFGLLLVDHPGPATWDWFPETALWPLRHWAEPRLHIIKISSGFSNETSMVLAKWNTSHVLMEKLLYPGCSRDVRCLCLLGAGRQPVR